MTGSLRVPILTTELPATCGRRIPLENRCRGPRTPFPVRRKTPAARKPHKPPHARGGAPFAPTAEEAALTGARLASPYHVRARLLTRRPTTLLRAATGLSRFAGLNRTAAPRRHMSATLCRCARCSSIFFRLMACRNGISGQRQARARAEETSVCVREPERCLPWSSPVGGTVFLVRANSRESGIAAPPPGQRGACPT